MHKFVRSLFFFGGAMGNLLALGVMLCGGYFIIKLKAFYIFHPLRCMRLSLCVLKDKESFRSFALALAGTLGVGNILGVCVGIELGGAGALLWIFVSGFFSSVIKYCEVVVSKDSSFRDNDGAHGGFHYAIRTCLGVGRGGALATLYSASLVLLSLLMGAALQSSAVIGSTAEFLDTPPAFISVFFTVAVLLGIVGGARRIEKITSFIIPIATIVYIILATSVIIINRSQLPEVLDSVFRSAFTLRSGAGGSLGTLLSPSIREGFCRGVLSNEAGVGTSSMAHSRSSILSPAVSGVCGMLEVFFDTTLLCTLTGIAVLSSGKSTGGIRMIGSAVSENLGFGAGVLLCFLIALFAYATVICWYFYGRESLCAILPYRFCPLFLLCYILFVGLGCFVGEVYLVSVIDCLIWVASVPVLAVLIKSSDRIYTLSELGGLFGERSVSRLKRRLSLKADGFSIARDGRPALSSRQARSRSSRE